MHGIIGWKIAIAFVHGWKTTCKIDSTELRSAHTHTHIHILNAFDMMINR